MSVSEIFNRMANVYDDISELWYAWLFSRIHFIITKEVIVKYNPKTVLDVGCGTGFQSFLHASVGSFVVGIDIAKDLIKVAREKISNFDPENGMVLFPIYFDFVDRYNKLIDSFLNKQTVISRYISPFFQITDARYLPFPNKYFDHVNCCGSVLCFVEDHERTLSEISRVLKRGGTFLLEVDSRWNMDRLWSIIDPILKGRLGYEVTLTKAFKALFAPPTEYILNKYPLGKPENQTCHLKAFTSKGLKRDLSKYNLKVLNRWTIHSLTNFIPSTYLDLKKPPKWLKRLFRFLAKIEERILVPLPGLSLVFLARKIG